MKSITELRTSLRFQYHEINSSIKYFAEQVNVDMDVYLPTLGFNLQRDFVWNIDQKRELIWSILMNRKIPRLAMMNINSTDGSGESTYQVIDGKQRLSSMIDFYRNEFTLEYEGVGYYFGDLPIDYQKVISGYFFPYYVAHEPFINSFTDQDKIDWFVYINFAGTPQDVEHFKKLKQ